LLLYSCSPKNDSKSSAEHPKTVSNLLGKWYFARMNGDGFPFTTIDFINDSVLLEDTERE